MQQLRPPNQQHLQASPSSILSNPGSLQQQQLLPNIGSSSGNQNKSSAFHDGDFASLQLNAGAPSESSGYSLSQLLQCGSLPESRLVTGSNQLPAQLPQTWLPLQQQHVITPGQPPHQRGQQLPP